MSHCHLLNTSKGVGSISKPWNSKRCIVPFLQLVGNTTAFQRYRSRGLHCVSRKLRCVLVTRLNNQLKPYRRAEYQWPISKRLMQHATWFIILWKLGVGKGTNLRDRYKAEACALGAQCIWCLFQQDLLCRRNWYNLRRQSCYFWVPHEL